MQLLVSGIIQSNLKRLSPAGSQVL